ncbi:hypothetical protein [Thiolapillus sp.]|uniref:hypothetical protein n=1 Tax=Thiolapillus sp. TaxID=2017437 RepID=UPI0025D8A323|nr:hypothetical protein [Thiolapillus sp.]
MQERLPVPPIPGHSPLRPSLASHGIRPPGMAEVQKMQEQISARPSLGIKKPAEKEPAG